jgi:hypothetical protein
MINRQDVIVSLFRNIYNLNKLSYINMLKIKIKILSNQCLYKQLLLVLNMIYFKNMIRKVENGWQDH